MGQIGEAEAVDFATERRVGDDRQVAASRGHGRRRRLLVRQALAQRVLADDLVRVVGYLCHRESRSADRISYVFVFFTVDYVIYMYSYS